MTRYFLIRHADASVPGHKITGRTPAPLTPLGLEQARRLAHLIGASRLEAIYSSPQRRAHDTARAIATEAGRDVRRAAALDELDYGDWTGQSIDALGGSPRWRSFNETRSITRIPRGELILEVQARIVAFIQLLRERHPEAAVALISHGDVIRAALVYYMGMPIDLMLRLEIDPASLTIMDMDESGPVIRCLNRTEPLDP